VAYRDARADDGCTAHPAVIPYRDWFAILWAADALPYMTVKGVCSCIDLNIGAKEATLANVNSAQGGSNAGV
jgi:hypothetical protein